MEILYQKTRIIAKISKYLKPYIDLLTKPTGKKLLNLILAVLSMQTLISIRQLYERFLAPLGKMSQNAYYYLLSYTELPLEKFARVTIEKAIALIDEKYAKLPILLLLEMIHCVQNSVRNSNVVQRCSTTHNSTAHHICAVTASWL